MKTIHEWLAEYGESHTHPSNVLIHKICVPAIMFSILGMLWTVPIGQSGLNAALAFVGLALIFYAKLSFKLCLGMVLKAGVMLLLIWSLQESQMPLLSICLGVFIVSWVFQFIGHKIEGKKPSFFQDLLFLLIGPLWTLQFLYKRFGIKV